MLFGWSDSGIGRFSQSGESVLAIARAEALRYNHSHVLTEHLMLGLLHEPNQAITRRLEQAEVDGLALHHRIEEVLDPGSEPLRSEVELAPRARRILRLASQEALDRNRVAIEPEHILRAIMIEGRSTTASILTLMGLVLTDESLVPDQT